jgi:hypothetical protein
MNFSKYKKQLWAEPRSQDPELLEARASSAEFRAEAAEAAEFEDKLEAAFAVDVPFEVLHQIRTIPVLARPDDSRTFARPWRWVALAAGVFTAVGVASVAWYESTFQWDSVNDYVVEHWAVDGAEVLGQADGHAVERAAADRIFASFGMQVSPSLAEKIDTVHRCRTPGSRGAHMVITTDQGPVTLIFMPEVDTVEGHILTFDHLVAATLELDHGSAVVIGPNEEIIAAVYAMARDGIRPIARTG